jgi:hypothetical protein
MPESNELAEPLVPELQAIWGPSPTIAMRKASEGLRGVRAFMSEDCKQAESHSAKVAEVERM